MRVVLAQKLLYKKKYWNFLPFHYNYVLMLLLRNFVVILLLNWIALISLNQMQKLLKNLSIQLKFSLFYLSKHYTTLLYAIHFERSIITPHKFKKKMWRQNNLNIFILSEKYFCLNIILFIIKNRIFVILLLYVRHKQTNYLWTKSSRKKFTTQNSMTFFLTTPKPIWKQ